MTITEGRKTVRKRVNSDVMEMYGRELHTVAEEGTEEGRMMLRIWRVFSIKIY